MDFLKNYRLFAQLTPDRAVQRAESAYSRHIHKMAAEMLAKAPNPDPKVQAWPDDIKQALAVLGLLELELQQLKNEPESSAALHELAISIVHLLFLKQKNMLLDLEAVNKVAIHGYTPLEESDLGLFDQAVAEHRETVDEVMVAVATARQAMERLQQEDSDNLHIAIAHWAKDIAEAKANNVAIYKVADLYHKVSAAQVQDDVARCMADLMPGRDYTLDFTVKQVSWRGAECNIPCIVINLADPAGAMADTDATQGGPAAACAA